jgi:hypothetical protein
MGLAASEIRLARQGLALRLARWLTLLMVLGGIGASTGYALVSRGARRDLEEP